MSNPYSGQDFFGFFGVLVTRLISCFTGSCFPMLFSDEIQCLVLVFLGILLAFLGTFLVLKQMTMLANALSHTILFGLVLAFLLFYFIVGSMQMQFFSVKILVLAATFASLITTMTTSWLTNKLRVQEDAAIGLVFTSLFAIGILLVTLFTRNLHFGVEAIMGNIDALHVDDVKNTAGFSVFVVLFFGIFFRGFFTLSFDPIFMQMQGWPAKSFNMLLMLLTSMSAILAFRAVGVLLFLSLLVGPVLIARLYAHTLKKLIFLSVGVSVSCSLFSVALSRHVLTVAKVPVSTAGLLSTCLLVVYCLALMCKSFKCDR